MKKHFFTLLFLCLFVVGFSQKKYPQNYFGKPVNIPMILSGTFGELRSNHFHAGLDIKTQKRTGWDILASAEGYVSRIKIAHWGYGKALYILHPNGYTTVYAHLKKFSPEIEAYIKKKQYEKESFEIELFPAANQLAVKKGELVAYSGNSGSSGGPHLHFEIRDANQRPMNPMLFGVGVADSKKPEIRTAMAYSFGDSSHVNKSQLPKQLVFKKQKNGNLLASPIQAYGTIGFGVNAIDKQDGAFNNNGIFELEMKVNGNTHYKHTVDKFSFNETRYLNALIDYERYYHKRQRIQKCFVEPANKLSIYENLVNNGFLTVKDSTNYTVEITAKDFKGNKRTFTIPVKGKKDTIKTRKKLKATPYFFKRKQVNKISDSVITVDFPKNSFYNDFYFDFKRTKDVVKLHNESVPLHKRFNLSYDISKHKGEQGKLFIARMNSKGKPYYSSTKRKPNKLTTRNKTLGKYAIFRDTIAPKIKPINFKNKQWLSKYRYLKVRITDDMSGIKSYKATIDGKWILMEYDPKRSLLTYDFNDRKLSAGKHTFKIVVTDNVNNSNTYIATFYRK